MQALLTNQPAAPQHSTTQYTNLYEILRILQEDTDTTDDSTIVATVLYLLQSGRLQFLHPMYVADLWADTELCNTQKRRTR